MGDSVSGEESAIVADAKIQQHISHRRGDLFKRNSSLLKVPGGGGGGGNSSSLHPISNGTRQRKFSVPAYTNPISLSVHHHVVTSVDRDDNRLQIPSSVEHPNPVSSKRRFSSVAEMGEAMHRKLSTISNSWLHHNVPDAKDLAEQARSLCGKYICVRLKRSGVLDRRAFGMKKMKSLAKIPVSATEKPTDMSEVFMYLQLVGQELERMHPKVYTGVSRQIGVHTNNAELDKTDHFSTAIRDGLLSIAGELFKSEPQHCSISWTRVVSLFAVVGGLAVDVALQGKTETLSELHTIVYEITETYLAAWLSDHGGWNGLVQYFKPPDKPSSSSDVATVVISVFTAILVVMVLTWLLGIRDLFAGHVKHT